MAKVLIVVTSHSEIDAEHTTGLWLEEFAVPYAALRKAGFEIVVASPHGGAAPVDPRSLDGQRTHAEALGVLAHTSTLQEAGDASDYAAIFLPGGHGTMFDFAKSQALKTLVTEFDAQRKIVAAVCHGPAAFVDAISAAQPKTLVAGKRITCFTDSEERETHLDGRMPFFLASKLREQGAEVIEGSNWSDHVEIDGHWITGQNPQSSASVAKAVVEALQQRAS